MPLANAVDPWGVIHPVCPSMMLMGNRGIPSSHDEAEVIQKLVWKGDPVTWQRAVRDEWPDLPEEK